MKMSFVKVTFAAFAISLFSSTIYADLVDWYMLSGAVYTDSSYTTIVPNGTLVRFGTFAPGYDFTGKTFSQLDTDFTVWGTELIGISPAPPGLFYGFNAYTTGPIGTQWYMFVGSSASSYGIFSAPSWVNDGDPFIRFADLSDPELYAVDNRGYVSEPDVALIPEPSTLILVALGAGVLAFYRSRRKSGET